MTASPFGFLRGAVHTFQQLLLREPQLGRGPPGEGGLVGDLHLENFGTLPTARGWVFHVNDFDETCQGPWRHDVLRLLTSLLLASQELGVGGPRALALCEDVLEGHQRALGGGRVVAAAPVQALLESAAKAAPKRLFDKHLASPDRLLRDEKHFDAPATLVALVPALVRRWGEALHEPPSAEKLQVLDVTRRLAGTGSLGVERLMVLLRGGRHPWLLDVKASPRGAQPVVEAMRAALPHPPLWLVPLELAGQSVLVRRLEPGEDRLALSTVSEPALHAVALQLGALTGQVHGRLRARRATSWGSADRRQLLAAAVRMAGLHHEAYLGFCAAVAATGVLAPLRGRPAAR